MIHALLIFFCPSTHPPTYGTHAHSTTPHTPANSKPWDFRLRSSEELCASPPELLMTSNLGEHMFDPIEHHRHQKKGENTVSGCKITLCISFRQLLTILLVFPSPFLPSQARKQTSSSPSRRRPTWRNGEKQKRHHIKARGERFSYFLCHKYYFIFTTNILPPTLPLTFENQIK